MNKNKTRIENELSDRVLLLDGSMGVMLQRLGLGEEGIRGVRFIAHPKPLASDLDILCLSRPEIVAGVHSAYLEAGADIIETNTFNANALSQKEFGTESLVKAINLAGARIAKKEADRYTGLTPDRPRFVAGSIGPTALSASLPVDVSDPEVRAVDFDTLADAYTEQAEGLIEGGVDILLIETAFDLLNAKAAGTGAKRAMRNTGRNVPVAFSMTVSDASGRILSGHTPEAFLTAIGHFSPLAVGFNCSAGPSGLAPILQRFAETSPFPIIFYPNAGLPDQLGNYSLSENGFAAELEPLLASGTINIVGGCCGTVPEHIARLRSLLDRGEIRPHIPGKTEIPWLSGFNEFRTGFGFINVGERCNVAGSRKFLRLIKEKNKEEALAIARKQVNDGAMILDINMDDAMLDASAEMTGFLRLLGSDPVTSSVPWMIDSSDFNVIESALKNIGGKGIVNSISLRDGEDVFIEQARTIASFGAAVVVMLFDENGQATTFERKTEIAARSVRLLTGKCGFSSGDIIIDPNILSVATGMPEHDRYALDYIRAVKWITDNFPGVRTSGGVSNLSFAFRGNNYLRQAMHAVFLYHAIRAGLTMAIVDPATKVTYSDIPEDLLERIEDVILCRRPDAADRLADIAANYLEVKTDDRIQQESDTVPDIGKRLELALRSGDSGSLEADLEEAVTVFGGAREVVEGPLMTGMEEVGRLFGCGKMFLPQVVKSARTMRQAVEFLRPLFREDRSGVSSKGKIIIATVRGDVHDIGKNIAAVVMRCNNFEVIDLGVQVSAETIVAAALEHKPDFIGLSGLITPSLNEMATTADALRKAGIKVPILVGGAATTELHTALRLAPAYGEGLVVRVPDASANPVLASRLLSDFGTVSAEIRSRQQSLAEEYLKSKKESSVSVVPEKVWDKEAISVPATEGLVTLPEVPVSEIRDFINFIYFFSCWKVKADSEEGISLRRDAENLIDSLICDGATMRCQIAIYPAYSAGDSIIAANSVTINTPRQIPREGRDRCLSLSDFIAPEEFNDHIGCFAVTTGEKIRDTLQKAKESGDEYEILLLQSVCDRLAEAASEWLHMQVRRRYWAYETETDIDMKEIRRGHYRGIRPAVGYPSLPDQETMHTLMRLLKPDEIGLGITENGALCPASSVAGLYIASPDARYFSVR